MRVIHPLYQQPKHKQTNKRTKLINTSTNTNPFEVIHFGGIHWSTIKSQRIHARLLCATHIVNNKQLKQTDNIHNNNNNNNNTDNKFNNLYILHILKQHITQISNNFALF